MFDASPVHSGEFPRICWCEQLGSLSCGKRLDRMKLTFHHLRHRARVSVAGASALFGRPFDLGGIRPGRRLMTELVKHHHPDQRFCGCHRQA